MYTKVIRNCNHKSADCCKIAYVFHSKLFDTTMVIMYGGKIVKLHLQWTVRVRVLYPLGIGH